MSRIDERLEAMQVDTSEMTTEQKFTAATGLTHYDEETASNDWYVPGGAANVVVESDEQGGGSQSGSDEQEQPQVYTAETAAAYNAELDGAVKAGDVQTAAQTVTTESDSYDYIYDEASWNASYANGGLKAYYEWSDAANAPYKEDLWNTVENRAANINDVKKDPDTNEYVLDENGNYVYENCERSWQGAVNAPGAKYPWIVPYFTDDVNAKIAFVYDEGEAVYPWDDRIFGTGEHKSFGCASVPVELGNEFLLENGETTFDISKFKMMLETEEPEVLYTEETAAEYNATLDGAVKAGDPIVSTAEIQTEP